MEYGGALFDLRSNRPFGGARSQIPDDWALYRSGRDALRAFARIAGKKRVLMPALCCASMILPFRQDGWEVAFYRLRPDYSADADDVLNRLTDDTVLLYMRYFGVRPFPDAFLRDLRAGGRGLLFLEDRTHDVWVPRGEDEFRPDAAAASLRKWAALPEGGMLRTGLGVCTGVTDTRYGDLRLDAMRGKDRCFETGDEALRAECIAADHRAEALLDERGAPVRMHPRYRELLCGLDFAAILEARRRNLRRLRARLEPLIADGTIRLMTDTPEKSGLYLPILIENRDAVQRELIRRRIYCPAAIWPEPPEAAGVCPVSRYTTEHMLSVLCDQRGSEADMDIIADNLADAIRLNS